MQGRAGYLATSVLKRVGVMMKDVDDMMKFLEVLARNAGLHKCAYKAVKHTE